MDDVRFEEAFKPQVLQALNDALGAAYRKAMEQPRRRCGTHDPHLFGWAVYRHAVDLLSELADEFAEVTLIKGQKFRLCVSGIELACHKVANSAHADIRTSFPGNSTGVRSMVLDQRLFPELEPDWFEQGQLVIAHVGNCEDGHLATYLCQALREENGRIVEWGFIRPILSEFSTQCEPKSDYALVPSEPLAEPMPELVESEKQGPR